MIAIYAEIATQNMIITPGKSKVKRQYYRFIFVLLNEGLDLLM